MLGSEEALASGGIAAPSLAWSEAPVALMADLCWCAQVAFHGFCPLFVLTSALMMTSCAVLGILGIVWSCTRGCAALVVLALGLLGDLMLFGGFVSCLIWLVLAVAVLYLYFVFLPSQYVEAEGGKEAPWWLQDLGSFQVSTDLDTVLAARPPFLLLSFLLSALASLTPHAIAQA